jgi:hypothetical protein
MAEAWETLGINPPLPDTRGIFGERRSYARLVITANHSQSRVQRRENYVLNAIIDRLPWVWRYLYRAGQRAGTRYNVTRDTAPRMKRFDAYRMGWWKGFDHG